MVKKTDKSEQEEAKIKDDPVYVSDADEQLSDHAIRGGFDGGWTPYVSVDDRRHLIDQAIKKLQANGQTLQPLRMVGNKVAGTFWGKAWCDHVTANCDYENRLPRGRSYLRSGAVIDLRISGGLVEAQVQGSTLYQVTLKVAQLTLERRLSLIERCTREIPDALSLLKGDLKEPLARLLIDQEQGLFPKSGELSVSCSCPDWARLCKHGAAVLYGIGYRFDQDPLSLFALRGILPNELLSKAGEFGDRPVSESEFAGELSFDSGQLEDIFGVSLDLTVRNEVSAKSDAGAGPEHSPKPPDPPAPRPEPH